MNLNSFEQFIDKKILERGYDYYIEGNICDDYSKDGNVYTFEVEGSDDYGVEVELNKEGDILNSYCDCPYNFGPVCKHEVAVYYELCDIFKNKSEEIRNNIPKIKEILVNISKEELVNIILDITKENKVLKNNIIFKYSNDNDNGTVIKNFEKLVSSIIKKYISRDGFIEYRKIKSFFNELNDILTDLSKVEDIELGIDITFFILREAMKNFDYEYDEEGENTYFFANVMNLLGDLIEKSKKLDTKKREKIFNKLLNEYNSNYFKNWDEDKGAILWLCIDLADIEPLREKLKLKIEECIYRSSNEPYKKESFLKILFDIVDKYGTKEERENFIMENLNFDYFREVLINEYIEKEKYEDVIQLTLDAEKQDENSRWGKNNKWKQFRYIAYKGLSKKEEQQKLAKELLFDGEFQYYKELKELASGREEEFYNELKQELKKSTYWITQDIFIKIILEENDLDELMEFVRKNPSHIEVYAKLLTNKFRSEVIDIYISYIKSSSNMAKDRKDYQSVCRKIKNYKNVCNENVEKIIEELQYMYKRRPAFVDELNNLK